MNQELGIEIKKDFPIFQNHPDLVYLDTAASSQTPRAVLEAMNDYYTKHRANIHRGVYQLSGEATELYENARKTVASFINANTDEIVFTSGTTQGLNGLAHSLCKNLKAGDNVVLTRMEHHANLVPWQEMARRNGFEARFIDLTSDFGLRTSDVPIDERTKIISFAHVSNVLGTINPAKKIVEMAKKAGVTTIVDAAQSIARMPVDVRDLDCDFFVFSGHKMYGPTGIGALYGRRERLNDIEPFAYGGDMVKEVTYEKATWNDTPWKFEAGTPNIAGAIGLAAAVRYLEKIGWENMIKHEEELTACALQELKRMAGLTIIGPMENRTGVISFTMDGIHPHDIAAILDQNHVAVRAGHHCAMPLMRYLGIPGTARISLGIYNTKDDTERAIASLKNVLRIFH